MHFEKYTWLLAITGWLGILTVLSERKLKPVYNPGCEAKCNKTAKLMYVQGIGDSSTLHYFWDFTHKPTFLLSLTQGESNVTIDWKHSSGCNLYSVNFTAQPSYTFGIVIDKIYEYNDVSDTGVLPTDGKDLIITSSEQFIWQVDEYVHDRINDEVSFVISSEGCRNCTYVTDGKIEIKAFAFGKDGSMDSVPKLAHTENSTQIDIVFDQFKSSFKNSRFGVELVVFSTDDQSSVLKQSSNKEINDENTPGVFIVDTLVAGNVLNKSNLGGMRGYMRWKPVAYTAPQKDMSNSTQVAYYGIGNLEQPSAILNGTIASALFGCGTNLHHLMIKAENVSFGAPEDGFYRKTNFSSWSFVIGLGTPPDESYSALMILALCFGLGMPILAIIGGVLYVIHRRSIYL